MRRIVALPVLGLALVAAACFDLAEPNPVVDGRMAHVIPGGADVVISVNGIPGFQLAPMGHAYYVVSTGPRTYDFVLGDITLTAEVDHVHDITGILLVDLGAGPTLRIHTMDRDGPNQRIKVVNGQATAGTLTVRAVGPAESYEMVLAPGEAGQFDPPTGRYHVFVRGEDDAEEFGLPFFDLEPGDFGFLVVAAGTDPAEPYESILF